jgi:CRISPR-associated endoribonuclease Cas6
MFDFELRAAPTLLEVGYYAGFGVENAQGFGCVGQIARN